MSFSDLEIVGRNVLKIEKNDIGRKVCDESSGTGKSDKKVCAL